MRLRANKRRWPVGVVARRFYATFNGNGYICEEAALTGPSSPIAEKKKMRIFWIGCGLLAALTFVVIPYVSNDQCKKRWEPMKQEAYWDWHTGCVVKVEGALIREENVQIGPAIRFNASKSN